MTIAILGGGRKARALASRFSALGHSVIVARREPKKDASSSLSIRSYNSALLDADLIVLVTSWEETRDAIEAAGDLSGKILLDCTNPPYDDAGELEKGRVTSGAEQVARWAQKADIVKVLNDITAEDLSRRPMENRGMAAFICGDSAAAKRVVHALIDQCGLTVFDAGPLQSARYLERLSVLRYLRVHPLRLHDSDASTMAREELKPDGRTSN